MALNPATLAAAMAPGIKSCFTTHLGALDNATMLAFANALALTIATDVIAHITSNAALVVVTACGAGAGTGTGTVT